MARELGQALDISRSVLLLILPLSFGVRVARGYVCVSLQYNFEEHS